MRLGLAGAVGGLCLLAGCSGGVFNGSDQTVAAPRTGAALTGRVYGGQQPIAGANVYLYAANITGYGNPSISLLTSATGNPADGNGNYYVTTDSKGNFAITGDYTCPSTASQLYLYSVGGDAGAGPNSGAVLVAALGTCPANGALSSSLVIVVNEVSTVAAAWSVASYTFDWMHVSSSGTTLAQAGIANAFATVTNLETLNTGLALATTPVGNGSVPQSEINTLANILAACVNSAGPSSAACTTLFTNATTGTTTVDTAQAAIAMVRNSQGHVAALFTLQIASTPFQPALSAQPNDFTIAINYTGGGLNSPYGIAVDASDNLWVANAHGNSISEFGPTGTAISPATTGFTGGGLSGPFGVAIDSAGNVWVTNNNAGTGKSLSKFNSSGVAITGSSGYTGGGLSGPYGLAFDQSGHLWVANNSSNSVSISEFDSSGTAISGTSGILGGGLAEPLYISIDTHGNVWVSNNNAQDISEFNSSGMAVSSTAGYTGGGVNDPGGMAIDYSGNVWTVSANVLTDLSEFDSTGTAVSGPLGYTGGGLNFPVGIAIDPSNAVWVSNYSGNSISKFFSSNGSPLSGASGWQGGGLSSPVDLAIDGAGNIWVTNSGSNSLTEFVGIARYSVVTPIVANLLAPYGAHAVTRP
jgi:streptogramin lyase